MLKKSEKLVLIAGFFVLINSYVFAQENKEENINVLIANQEEVVAEDVELPEADFEFTDGQVVKADTAMIEIIEYDFEKGQDVNAVYLIDNDTVLEDYGTYDKVKKDDYVEILYEVVDGKKMAKMISKLEYEEDYAGEAEAVNNEENITEEDIPEQESQEGMINKVQ